MYVTLDFESAADFHTPAVPVAKSVIKQVANGQSLFFEGDTANYLYKIKSGVLRQSRVLPDGRTQIISFGFAGDIVGLPVKGYHHTNCDVLETAELELIPAKILNDPATSHPAKSDLMAYAMEEIAGMQDHFMMLALKTAKEKLASFLLTVSQRSGRELGNYTEVSLPMARTDIADFLGMTIETVSRQLSELRKAKIIAVDGTRTVVILDHDMLQDAAG